MWFGQSETIPCHKCKRNLRRCAMRVALTKVDKKCFSQAALGKWPERKRGESTVPRDVWFGGGTESSFGKLRNFKHFIWINSQLATVAPCSWSDFWAGAITTWTFSKLASLLTKRTRSPKSVNLISDFICQGYCSLDTKPFVAKIGANSSTGAKKRCSTLQIDLLLNAWISVKVLRRVDTESLGHAIWLLYMPSSKL